MLTFESFIPKILGFAIVLLMCSSLKINSLPFIFPALDVIFIFYWSIYYPTCMPYWYSFLLSILLDIVIGIPIGVSALINLIFQHLVIAQRRFFLKKPFIVAWCGFLLFSFLICSCKLILLFLMGHKVLFSKIILFHWLFTFALYPWVHFLLHKIYLSMEDNIIQ